MLHRVTNEGDKLLRFRARDEQGRLRDFKLAKGEQSEPVDVNEGMAAFVQHGKAKLTAYRGAPAAAKPAADKT